MTRRRSKKWWTRPITKDNFKFLLDKLQRDKTFVMSPQDRRDIVRLMYFYQKVHASYLLKSIFAGIAAGIGSIVLLRMLGILYFIWELR